MALPRGENREVLQVWRWGLHCLEGCLLSVLSCFQTVAQKKTAAPEAQRFKKSVTILSLISLALRRRLALLLELRP